MDKKLSNRLSRLEGQLKKLHQNIEEGKDCVDITPQFLAVKGAFASAFEEYIKSALVECDRGDTKMREALIHILVK